MKKIERIQWLHSRIIANSYPNARDLSENFGISMSQSKRDIEYLRKSLNAPLVYNSSRKGYSYSVDYPLPEILTADNEHEYSAKGISDINDTIGSRSSSQLQLPYTSTVKVADRLAVLELRPFIINNIGKNLYSCEFRSIELFLSVILSLNADIRIVEPEWLRSRLVESAERVIKNNSQPQK